MTALSFAIWVFVALVAGFATGVIVSKTVLNDVQELKQGTQHAVNAIAADINSLHTRLTAVEGEAKNEVSTLIH